MFPDSVINVLLADNPWLEGENRIDWIAQYLPDNYVNRDIKIELSERVELIIGPRQAGKSSLIWKTLSGLSGSFLFVNCEEPAIRDWVKSPALFIQGLKQLVSEDSIVFFEEVQHLEEAGLFLKGLVDRKSSFRFCATGSSSYELESKTRESLAGRAERHLLLPFSYKELTTAGTKDSLVLQMKHAESIVEQLIIYGGYPSVYLGKNKEATLTGLVESFIIRDASDRFRIKHTAAFRKLLELIASQIGNLCNYSNWASSAGISADTVRDYTAILSDTHVVKFVRPFLGGKRAEITSTPKVYFVDNGIRNRLFGGFGRFDRRPDKGALLENYVFTGLYKSIHPLIDTIRFWRSKSGSEVDFIVERYGQLIAIEVKAGHTKGKLTRSACSFIDAYEPSQFWVFSDKQHPSFTLKNTEVHFITASQLYLIFR